MKRPARQSNHCRLMDHLAPEVKHGPMLGFLATTYEMQPEFFETDYLPTLLGLGAWDDRNWTSRIAMEKHLAQMEAAVVVQDAYRYQGRPRSLRVEIAPATPKSPGQQPRKLHAKVTLIVHEKAVRLIVGSSNLTEPGYRRNREVAATLVAMTGKPGHAPLIRSALTGLQGFLGPWLSEGAGRLVHLADERLSGWEANAASTTTWFAWGGGPTPLWRSFLDRWPAGEPVERIRIVSPFWSEEEGHGPLTTMLRQLGDRNVLAPGAKICLLAKAIPETASSWRPQLPESFKAFDPACLGVSAEAWAVDPLAAPEEVGLGDDFCATRELHAKVVLLEGPETSLAYIGSANFSRRGWGFLSDPQQANIEAGIILQRAGSGREHLKQLVPPTVGEAVVLGSGTPRITAPPASADPAPWPAFVREILLSPSAIAAGRLDLVARTSPELVCGPWKLSLIDTADPASVATLLAVEAEDARHATHRIALSEQALNHLMKDQEVLVSWWTCAHGCAVPINVDQAARQDLPMVPGRAQLGEQHLLAYYQGRIAWEDLYPPPEETAAATPGAADDEKGPVDTSRIQSYQIREFVEALSGIMADLKGAAQATRPCMRLALLGSVSPVALARQIHQAVETGRTPVAAGFQLVEILACLQYTRGLPADERSRKDWGELLDEAVGQVEGLLGELRRIHPNEFGSQMFKRYEATARKTSTKRPAAT